MICELPFWPQEELTDAGQIGTRVWSLDAGDNLHRFLTLVCESCWPNAKDSLPIRVIHGPFMGEQAVIKSASERTTNTLGDLPKYGKIKVVAQYQLHNLTNCWPEKIPKPWHPPGTTLTLRVMDSTQVVTAAPTGMTQGGGGLSNGGCGVGTKEVEALMPSTICRVIVPITEYHLTCDRLTAQQVGFCFGSAGTPTKDWDHYCGTVNYDPDVTLIGGYHEGPFLGAVEGTLLMDSYQLEEAKVPHPTEPYRYRLTAIFKQRNIMGLNGKPLADCDTYYVCQNGDNDYPKVTTTDHPVGWNHDLTVNGSGFGWHFIRLQAQDGDCENRRIIYRPRYPYSNFHYLFGGPLTEQKCGGSPDPGSSIGDICGSEGYDGSSMSPQSDTESFGSSA